ncbi:hypothetical protein A2773_04525 [Candidatus Gottesmanbacteria bacterium RIFCSPHIGHO2_01_FULL_39_10]|uniref:SpoVT-AbrB domain-containing protein n=1 Tax=Candidatus Gottesmanbacteria bacterium RIFCSPHIGHO2_01_FULL_39_10 TaxID=1798375 RepID=A0A1F5ZSP4_9BACT|nr:MAG: hypothetical protein A2773_04525 [Candidatus Gottesmanbacteria bacterium RIFCSPHIGHO2_01_FULL_39_10]
MIHKVIKTGHSLAIVIPSKIAKIMGIKAGDRVRLTAQSEKGKIILSFSGSLQLTLSLEGKRKK